MTASNHRPKAAGQSPRRPTLPLRWATLAVAVWLAALCNGPLWARVRDASEGTGLRDELFLVGAFISVVALFNLLLTLATLLRPLAKPVLALVLLVAGLAAAFMEQYGTLIDRSMIQNVFETDAAEASELFTFQIVLLWLALGGLPAWALSRCSLSPSRTGVALIHGSVAAAVSAGSLVVVVLSFGSDYASLMRNHRELRFMLTPTNVIWYTGSYLSRQRQVDRPLEVVGSDAVQTDPAFPGSRPSVVVLVVGETARAADFSLGGHAPDTTPLLRQAGGIYFDNIRSCGTATAISLPCMFSDLGRSEFNVERARRRENLLDVVERAGLDVLWLNNNSGCKGVCARVDVESFDASQYPDLCSGRDCFDEVLVRELRQQLASLRRHTLIVLHQKGSHGPAYYKRYPPAFARFQPTCTTGRLSDCTPEALHNTYDNTIYYTDFILAEVIESLRQGANQFDSAMFYVSDHGESLGESGLYLHGAPQMIAPSVQLHVPAYAWFSEGFLRRRQLDLACVQDNRNERFTHDNFFHTALGLNRVATSAYRRDLDMFAACRSDALPARSTHNG